MRADPPGVESFPPWKQFEMQPKDEVQFRLKGSGRSWQWTVNGRPAGSGEEFTLKPDATGKVIVRGTGVDAEGHAVDRAWEIQVRGGAATPAAPADVAEPRRPKPAPRVARTPRPSEQPEATEPPTADAPPPDIGAPPLPAPPVAADRAPSAAAAAAGPDAVRGLLDRYAAAYRQRNVDELRRLGQVTNEGQAKQMREYFDKTPELDVEVKILDVQRDGDKTKVRFTRRDRFKDPTGNEVSKETPPIEKEVVETPDGLKLKSPEE